MGKRLFGSRVCFALRIFGKSEGMAVNGFYSPSNIRLITTSALISRLAAS